MLSFNTVLSSRLWLRHRHHQHRRLLVLSNGHGQNLLMLAECLFLKMTHGLLTDRVESRASLMIGRTISLAPGSMLLLVLEVLPGFSVLQISLKLYHLRLEARVSQSMLRKYRRRGLLSIVTVILGSPGVTERCSSARVREAPT